VTNTSQLLFISLGFGFSLCVCAWVFFRVSGGLFNPAVSLGLALVGAISPVRAGILVFAQLLGGMAGAAIIQVLLPGPLYVNTTLSGGISVAQGAHPRTPASLDTRRADPTARSFPSGLFLEMFLTALLMLTILLLAAEKHKATYLAPVGIGLSLFIAEMTGVYWTGGSLNPVRTLLGSC
jgi:aquaporin related protein